MREYPISIAERQETVDRWQHKLHKRKVREATWRILAYSFQALCLFTFTLVFCAAILFGMWWLLDTIGHLLGWQ